MADPSLKTLSSPLEVLESPANIQKRRGATDECSAPARKRPALAPSSEASISLCQDCSDIPLAGLASRPPATRSGKRVIDLLSLDRQVLGQSRCPLCRLLSQVVPEYLEGKDCYLQALSSSLAILGRHVPASERKEHSDCTVLFPVLKAKSDDKTYRNRIAKDWQNAGFLALVSVRDHDKLPDTGPRQRQMMSVIDFKLIKSWLGQCDKYHKSCRFESGGSDFVRGLQVIDCELGRTVDAPGRCKYFALSYVWGKPTQPHSPRHSGSPARGTAAEWPRVVHDAVEVTRSLGERYLWVDQYCIDQKPGTSMDEQIAQMDKIYSQARLTLVAAAGEDSSYGLPGIGTKERLPMQSSIIDNIAIIQMPPHLSAQISRSTWAERGWTYQEGYLSPRRLIFTDYEVSYLCDTVHCTESLKKPLMVKKSERKTEMSDFLEIIPNAFVQQSEPWHELKQKQLPNYTRRKLTKTSDSINAVLGLFRTLKSSGIRNLHGIPIRQVPPLAASNRVELCLAWHHDVVAKRCPDLPSWSWSGWVGGIRMSEPDVRISDVRQIALVEEDGGTVPLKEWFNNEMQLQASSSTIPSKILRISAMTVWVSFEERSWTDLNEQNGTQSRIVGMSFIDGTYAVLPISEDVTALCYAYMDEDVSLESGALGLVLSPKCQKWRYTIILLRPDGSHYQRIGLVRVSSYNNTRPAAVNNLDPPIVYVDREGIPRKGFERGDDTPLWLQRSVEKTVTIL
ncbi:hypothetical protein NW768_011183 [Fusarium equiseti]|uniref:Heterokaryon incompatibility domain-containing protein n=1 Tax=Fusarium equiseti TaxID=61235 RepID=A0ABQ8QYM5_FUSEQ|nr:hypothetical protein NW768_011183 [Fusarium equiseti]